MRHSDKTAGFTLIESMIVVAIVAILSTIATPSYTDYLVKQRRSQAKEAITAVVGLMEQYYYDNNHSYATAVVGSTLAHSATVPNNSTGTDVLYELSIVATTDSYTITATPKNRQTDDGVLTINNHGKKTWVVDSETRQCWETSCS